MSSAILLKAFLVCAVLFVAAAPTPNDYSAGVITAPANGTAIAPGQPFNFSYNIHADYCVSSYDFAVWLVTDMPSSFAVSDSFMSGYYFGTYELENYPAVPNPPHPPPAQLVMPDFSKSEGGFGGGKNASDMDFHLVVVEEWDSCDGALGRKVSLAANHVIYNASRTPDE